MGILWNNMSKNGYRISSRGTAVRGFFPAASPILIFLLSLLTFVVLSFLGKVLAQDGPSVSSSPRGDAMISQPEGAKLPPRAQPSDLIPLWKPKPYEPEIKPWRQSTQPMNHRDIERLARDIGYQGARVPSSEPEGHRSPDALAMRGDVYFRKHLEGNNLQYLDHIDNRETGMQATLVKDKAGDGRVYVIFRGTEPNYEAGKDLVSADLGQWTGGHLSVGKNQYEGDKSKLDEWAENHNGNITVVGHSLGGALGQRFIADHPQAVKDAVLFNSPAVEPDVANRVPKDKLPPISYYLQKNDIVSNMGGFEHMWGTINVVEGGDTENPDLFLSTHRGIMLDGRANIVKVDYDKHQSERTYLIQLSQRADKEARAFEAEIDGQLGGVRGQIGAAQARAAGAAQSVGNAAAVAQRLFAELQGYRSKMASGPNACRDAFMKSREIEQSAAKIVKYVDGAAKGAQIARTKVEACGSKEDVRAGLGAYDAARKLGREALSERSKIDQEQADLNRALDQAGSARANREPAERVVEQIAAEVASARAFAKQAKAEGESLHRLADHLRTRKNVLLARAGEMTSSILSDGPTVEETMYYRLLEEKMRPLRERINVPDPIVADHWSTQADGQVKRAEETLSQARAIIGQLRGLNFAMCDLVTAPDEARARAESAAGSLDTGGVDVELLQKANRCLAKLSPPDALQSSAARPVEPAQSKNLLDKAKEQIDKDRLAQEKERLEKLKDQERKDREEAGRREKARQDLIAKQRAEQHSHAVQQSHTAQPPDQSVFDQPSNPMESLLSGLSQGLQQGLQQQPRQQPAQHQAQPQQPARQPAQQTQRSQPQTRTASAPAAAPRSSSPKYFALIFTAYSPSQPAYQKVPECRYMRTDGPWPISQAKAGEIEKTASDMRASGRTVEVRYLYSEDEAYNFQQQWNPRVSADTDRCLNAQHRFVQGGK